MNKYEEALDNVKKAPGFMGGNHKYISYLQSSIPFLEDIAILQELVNKEKPMRTETEVLKDFEKLGYEIKKSDNIICLLNDYDTKIRISKVSRTYRVYYKKISGNMIASINMQEHKLLNELFTIWNWL